MRKFGVRIWKYGAEIYLFDHDVFDGLLQSVCSQDRQLAEKSRNSYAVVSADRFITVGHQNTSFFGSKNRLRSATALGLVPILKALRANQALVY